jgi:hypothetical protein
VTLEEMILDCDVFGAWGHLNGGGSGYGPIIVIKKIGLGNQVCDARELNGGEDLQQEPSQGTASRMAWLRAMYSASVI